MAVNVKLEHNTDKKLPSPPSSSVPSKIKPTMGQNAPMKTEKTDYEEEHGIQHWWIDFKVDVTCSRQQTPANQHHG